MFYIDSMLREQYLRNVNKDKPVSRINRQKMPIEEPDDQYLISKNKFYGKTLDR